MYNITFCFTDTETNKKTTKVLHTKSLDVSVLNCCKKLYKSDGIYIFEHYYSNDIMMGLFGCFPYIFNEGRYVWKVPYEDVTLFDFMKTHSLKESDIIYINVEYYGGAEELDIQFLIEWFEAALPLFGNFIDTALDYKEYFTLMVCVAKFFRKRVPSPKDVAEVIQLRHRWTVQELGNVFGTNDQDFCIKLLTMAGYKKRSVDGAYYGSHKVKNIEQSIDKISNLIWGKMSNGRFAGVDVSIRELNQIANVVFIYSEATDSDCYDLLSIKINELIECNKGILKKGNGLQIVARQKMIFVSDETIEDLQEEIGEIIQIGLYYYDYLSRKSIVIE